MRIYCVLPIHKISSKSREMNFTHDEKDELKMLIDRRQTEIETEMAGAPHSNQQLMQTEVDLLISILEKIEGSTPIPAVGGRRRRAHRKTRKGRKNRKD